MEKITELMQEYKHTDVFYVGVRPISALKGKSLDHSDIAQSTEIHSDNIESGSRLGQSSLYLENETEHLVTYSSTKYRFFGLYYYKIQIPYAGKIFADEFLLERDELSDDFFELYLKDLLSAKFQDYFVTHHEANRKFIRDERNDR